LMWKQRRGWVACAIFVLLIVLVVGLMSDRSLASRKEIGSPCWVDAHCPPRHECMRTGRGPIWTLERTCELYCVVDANCPEGMGCWLVEHGPGIPLCM
jgi:hypothetical protein